MQRCNRIRRKASPLQTGLILAEYFHFSRAQRSRERQYILGDHAETTDDGVLSHAAELVDRGSRADDGPIVNRHVTAESCRMPDHGVTTDGAIVRHVNIC